MTSDGAAFGLPDSPRRSAISVVFQPADGKFPGVSLDALELLHLERKILLRGHELIDTDSTPTLIGEDRLLNNGYMQAEGVANLDQVPATGALRPVERLVRMITTAPRADI